DPISPIDFYSLIIPNGKTLDGFLEEILHDPAILHAQPEGIVKGHEAIPNDTRFGEQWGLHNLGQTGGVTDADIDAPEAWVNQSGSSSIVIAVIDTGFNREHEDLKGRFWMNKNEVPENGVDDDANGYVDDLFGYDFAMGDPDPNENRGHGTRVSGVVGAATNNGVGVAGVCWDSQTMALKVFADGKGWAYDVDIAEAIDYARWNGARVINLSLGGPSDDFTLRSAVSRAIRAGVTVVASAGNEGIYGVGYPARYPEVIAVGAIAHTGKIAGFSSRGPEVDVVAPGENILSTYKSGYAYADGTSFSSPMTAGVVGLLLSKNPSLTPDLVQRTLKLTADPSGDPNEYGSGRVNAKKALDAVTPVDGSAVPIIYNARISGIQTCSVEITWNTNEPTVSFLEYGLTPFYGMETKNNDLYRTTHTAVLYGLAASRLYHYRVRAQNVSGLMAQSGDFTFLTLGEDFVGRWFLSGDHGFVPVSPMLFSLPDGDILMISENQNLRGIHSQIYNPNTRRWNDTQQVDENMSGARAVSLDNGEVLLSGATWLDGNIHLTTKIFSWKKGWRFAERMWNARMAHALVPLPNNGVLAAGGLTPDGHALRSCEIYDYLTNSWTETASLNQPRFGHTMTVLADGRILVTGGRDEQSSSLSLNSCEIFDPRARRWESANPMRYGRTFHAATLLKNGKVLVTGGSAESEIYDPQTNQWSLAAPMQSKRSHHAAVRTGGGRVFAVGGTSRQGEMYDPQTDRWKLISCLNFDRSGNPFKLTPNVAAIVLPKSRFLVVGESSQSEYYEFDEVPPQPPELLTANGRNPSPWNNRSSYTIQWRVSKDPSGTEGAFYSLNGSNAEFVSTVSSFTADFQGLINGDANILNVWLKDGAGNSDPSQFSKVFLRMDTLPP
ncbi:MAG: S8 family serine peptidase, partial [Elusimicrobia bacterium]|nr:S8 family serine peptidase [Elusimicrobiota bacterium]